MTSNEGKNKIMAWETKDCSYSNKTKIIDMYS